MPGNLVVINKSDGLTWYVGDSKMDELIKFLHENGLQEQPDEPVKTDEPDTVPVITVDYCKECGKLRILSVEDRPVSSPQQGGKHE